jgi:hypothetical protein
MQERKKEKDGKEIDSSLFVDNIIIVHIENTQKVIK